MYTHYTEGDARRAAVRPVRQGRGEHRLRGLRLRQVSRPYILINSIILSNHHHHYYYHY